MAVLGPFGDGHDQGAEVGEIKTEALEGTLVDLSKTAKTVGVDFKPQTGTSLASFKCLSSDAEIRGSVVLPITGVNVRTSNSRTRRGAVCAGFVSRRRTPPP